ncbi:hypothetical protein MYMA111404_02440 [Mycoplasma marinum]
MFLKTSIIPAIAEAEYGVAEYFDISISEILVFLFFSTAFIIRWSCLFNVESIFFEEPHDTTEITGAAMASGTNTEPNNIFLLTFISTSYNDPRTSSNKSINGSILFQNSSMSSFL